MNHLINTIKKLEPLTEIELTIFSNAIISIKGVGSNENSCQF